MQLHAHVPEKKSHYTMCPFAAWKVREHGKYVTAPRMQQNMPFRDSNMKNWGGGIPIPQPMGMDTPSQYHPTDLIHKPTQPSQQTG